MKKLICVLVLVLVVVGVVSAQETTYTILGHGLVGNSRADLEKQLHYYIEEGKQYYIDLGVEGPPIKYYEVLPPYSSYDFELYAQFKMDILQKCIYRIYNSSVERRVSVYSAYAETGSENIYPPYIMLFYINEEYGDVGLFTSIEFHFLKTDDVMVETDYEGK